MQTRIPLIRLLCSLKSPEPLNLLYVSYFIIACFASIVTTLCVYRPRLFAIVRLFLHVYPFFSMLPPWLLIRAGPATFDRNECLVRIRTFGFYDTSRQFVSLHVTGTPGRVAKLVHPDSFLSCHIFHFVGISILNFFFPGVWNAQKLNGAAIFVVRAESDALACGVCTSPNL